jgi:LuxR family quorum-sensing transcriptional regulator LasR
MAPSADHDLGKILAPLTEATSNSAVKSIATLTLSSIGFESWVFVCDNPRSIFGMSHIMSGIPIQWVATYAAKGYVKIDPIIKHCRESEDPLYWDAIQGWEFAEDNVKEFMRRLHAYGFGSGMAIPLRSSSGKIGILSIVSAQSLEEERENYLQNFPSARTLGMALHAAIDRIASI